MNAWAPEPRDLPLSFGVVDDERYMEVVYRHFHINTSLKPLYRRAMDCLVAEAVQAKHVNRFVSYSIHKNFYTGKRRYFGSHFTYQYIPYCIQLGMSMGMFEGKKAKSGDHRRTHEQSTFRATDELVKLLEGATYRRVLQETVILKRRCKEDKDKDELVDYEDTSDTIRWREEMEEINAYLATLEVAVPTGARNGPFVITKEGLELHGPVSMRRIFNRGSFDCYGRIHGWHQNVRKDLRRQITINGQPVVELDFATYHTAMLYAEKRIQLKEDPYDVIIYGRKRWKRAINIILNSKVRAAAIGSLHKHLSLPEDEARFLYILIESKLPEIREFFCKDTGIRLMRKDSDIMVDIMLSLVRRNIPCLPIHDSVMCPAEYKDTVAEVMQKSYQRFNSGFTCGIEIKERHKILY